MKHYAYVLLFLLAAVFVSAQIGEGKNIVITLVNQEPDPVEPGNYVTLRFKVENWGSENAEEMVLEVIPQHPFSIDGSPSQNIGSVWGRQKGDVGAIAKFRVKVDETSAVGITELYVRYKTKNSDWIQVGPYNISVQSPKAVLTIRDADIPDSIAPGQKANITLYLQNTAKSLIRNVAVKLDLSNSLAFSQVGFNEKIIDTIQPGQTHPVTFVIVAMPEAATGAQKIPITLTYNDELNAEYVRNGTLGILVGSKADLDVQIESTTFHSKETPGEVAIKFVNKGFTDIKFLNVKLLESDSYDIISPSTFYIGEIDADDYETAEFSIYPKTDSASLLLQMEYKDANNNPYTSEKSLPLNLYSESDAKRLGLIESGGNGFMIMLLVVVVGLAAFFFLRRKK